MTHRNPSPASHTISFPAIKDAPFFILPLLILMAYLFLGFQKNLAAAAPEMVGATGLIVMLLALGMGVTDKSGNGWSPAVILAFGTIFRLLFLWRAPELSDDIFRYVLDGMMTMSGNNPYAAAPANVLPSDPQMADLISLVNHPHLTTIYPPAAQLVFALGSFTGGVFGMKAVLVLLDLGTCAVILRLLRHLRLPASRAILYAWHPLPVIETGASGHIDAAAVFFLLSAFLLILSGVIPKKAFPLSKARPPGSPFLPISAGVMIALSIFTKWMPLIFLPGFWMMTPRQERRHVFSGFLAAALILPLLFMPEFTNSLNTLSAYLQGWEFSGFLFRYFRGLSGSGKTARVICILLFMAISAVVYGRIFMKHHPITVYKGWYAITFAFLALTPTLHPWYALYLAALLPFAGGPAGLVFSWSVFLSYRVVMAYGLTGQWIEPGGLPLLIIMAPGAATLAGVIPRMATRTIRESQKIRKSSVHDK